MYLGMMLLGNNVALVIFGIFMGDILSDTIIASDVHPVLSLFTQTIISTLIILITAEFLPKNLFRINPNGILNIFSFPVAIIYGIMFIPVFLIIRLSEFILKMFFNTKISNDKPVFGRVDLDHYLKEGNLYISDEREIDHEVQIFQNALEFSKVKARECMIPRTEIVALSIDDSVADLKAKFIETGLSKILIYKDSIDNIIGYTHSYEQFKKPETIRSILLPVSIIPESMPANEILTVFIQQHKSIALVVDEFGGTSGVLTMEDVIEELVGEIKDEHDVEAITEMKINDNEYVFSARIEIDYVNEKYKLKLPISEDYETLGGLITHYHESIPQAKEEIKVEQFLFIPTSVSHTRIELVHLKVLGAEA